MPPKSILKKKTAPGRTSTGKRARPGQNIRKAAQAEAESLKAKSKGKKVGGRVIPDGGRGETASAARDAKGRAGQGGSKFSASASMSKFKGGKPDPRSRLGGKGEVDNGKGKKRVRVDHDMSDEDEGVDEDDNDFGDEGEDDEGPATDEEIEKLQNPKSASSGNKRKRPTTASEFGSTLTSLLGDQAQPQPSSSSTTRKPAPSQTQPILSLSRNRLPPSRSKLALERKAEEAVKRAKTERVERARVKDVMEGWQQPGGSQEFERGLRKVAQRGVIKLFNAILSASKAAEEGLTTAEQAGYKDEKTRRKEKDNVLGRGGKEPLTKEGFLDMVRKG